MGARERVCKTWKSIGNLLTHRLCCKDKKMEEEWKHTHKHTLSHAHVHSHILALEHTHTETEKGERTKPRNPLNFDSVTSEDEQVK